MYHFFYIDSLGKHHKINFHLNEYASVMELIWDRGYEDWGDCKGRAWCGTCHIRVDHHLEQDKATLHIDEQKCLNQLYNRTKMSRISCQILLSKNIHEKAFVFLGDD